MDKPIGGYFGWEFPKLKGHFPHDEGLLVNSGHNAFQYLLQVIGTVSRVYVPYYTCSTVLIPLQHLDIPYTFYHIDEHLELAEEIYLRKDEYLIYTNYFGLKDSYAQSLAKQYGGQLIIDNAQALFAKSIEGCYQIYSPRKYVGCPDGGILEPFIPWSEDPLDRGISFGKCQPLLQRADGDVSGGYAAFQEATVITRKEPLRLMSHLTESVLRSIDYDEIIQRRLHNYDYLHEKLQGINRLGDMLTEAKHKSFACPMIYPFYSEDASLRGRLIANKIFVAQYWPNVLEWCTPGDVEYRLTEHIIAVPIDQRYEQEDMDRILDVIKP